MKAVLPGLILVFLVSRLVAADFTVTNTNSSGPGSLYQAITDANNTPGADRILFNIPGLGVHKIDVGPNPLPTIIESLVIDGYSQPGAKANSLAVGSNAVILIQIDSGTYPKQASEGLLFDRAKAANGQDYLVSDYSVRGVALTGFYRAIRLLDANSMAIGGNFIGVLPDGHTRAGGGSGITIEGITTGRAIIGGTDLSARNVISGNGFGIWVPNGARATVQGNYIGTDASGTSAVANSWGAVLVGDLYDTVIGGTTPGAGNLVSGNNFAAITLGWGAPTNTPQAANGARISGNLIGVQADGIKPLGNIGWAIALEAGIENIIGGLEPGAGNLIANNGLGIVVGNIQADQQTPPAYNRILSNVIYNNRAVGIDLGNDGPTANDEGDADIGANALQNAPVIESAEIANGSVTIKGSLESTENTQYTLQYFSESLDLVRPVQTYLGTSIVTTDDNGRAQFSTTFPVSDTNVSFNMTATSENGNTSEFSRNAPRMLNISTRANVQTGDRVLIAGFIVRSNLVNREMIVRGLGPSLQSGGKPLAGTLSDPYLEFHYGNGSYSWDNDNWRDFSTSGYLAVFGLTPTDEREAALFNPGTNGADSVVIRGAHGETGIGVAEVYDLRAGSFGGFGDVANISTRGFVGTGDNVMIAGTILEQTVGMTRIVARALGPSLAAAGVSDPLPDPVLELHDSQGGLIASNDNWRDGQRDALIAVGLAPTNDNESAIFMRVPSGSFTAIVHGKNESTGVALVELYNLH